MVKKMIAVCSLLLVFPTLVLIVWYASEVEGEVETYVALHAKCDTVFFSDRTELVKLHFSMNACKKAFLTAPNDESYRMLTDSLYHNGRETTDREILLYTIIAREHQCTYSHKVFNQILNETISKSHPERRILDSLFVAAFAQKPDI